MPTIPAIRKATRGQWPPVVSADSGEVMEFFFGGDNFLVVEPKKIRGQRTYRGFSCYFQLKSLRDLWKLFDRFFLLTI